MALTRRACIAAFIVLSLSVIPVFGQSSGAVLGAVMDASGASIPGVEVTVTNQGTNQTRQTITNETGSYRIEPLQAGVYSVSAELVGFRKEIRKDLTVDVDARVRVDFNLEVGAVSEVVEVLGAAPVLQTDNSQIGQVIDERKILDLPLNGRNFSSLTYIAPGSFAPRVGSRLADRGGFVVAGMEEGTNEYLIDGAPAMGGLTLELAARINVDAVGEFKIQTQNYAAQYGRFAGGHVDAITKAGTNEFHGSLFGFTRNDNLDARNFFDPYPLEKKPEFRRHQYGGVLGGPIKRDKAFFFVGFQGQRQFYIRTTNATIPLPEFWEGNLSRLNKEIRDPRTGQPFQNNQIPKDRIHPSSLKWQPLFNAATLNNNTLVRNATGFHAEPDNFWSPNGKINYNLSDKHQIIGSYMFFANTVEEWNYAQNPEIPGFGLTSVPLHNQLASFQDVYTVSPTMVNEFRVGWDRIYRIRRPDNRERDYARDFFKARTFSSDHPKCWAYPQVTITGYSRIGQHLTATCSDYIHGNYNATDVISIQRGNHAIKAGVDAFKQVNWRTLGNGSNGVFAFTGSVTGDAFADFLLGYIDNDTNAPSLGPDNKYSHRWTNDWFIQDDWKVSRNLTLNVGLRYELNFPWVEKYGVSAWFDPALDGGRGGIRILSKALKYWPAPIEAAKRLYPTLAFATADKPHDLDKNNLAPRVGFAWSPGSGTKTVVRGGYGVFYTILGFSPPNGGFPLFQTQRFTRKDNPTWDDPFPASAAAGTITIGGYDTRQKDTYYQQWNLGIQREMPFGVVLDVSYSGKKGTAVSREIQTVGRDINQPINGVRPYPLFGAIIMSNEHIGNNNYNGLQIRVERRASQGPAVLVAYSYGKSLGDDGPIRDGYNLRQERGRQTDDMRHRLVTSFLFPLPIGRGRAHLNSLGGLANSLIGGWDVSGIFRGNSGSPFTPVLSQDFSGNLRPGDDRPDLIGNPKLANPNPRTGWWDPAAFRLPARGTSGNAGKGILTGPAYVGTDLSIAKHFNISESKAIEFRWEIFNAFNNVNFLPAQFNASTVVFNSPDFGTFGNALPSRQMQAGMKFIF